MKKLIYIIFGLLMIVSFSSCAIHDDFVYDGYYTNRYYVTYDVYPYHYHHHHVVKQKNYKKKHHKDAIHKNNHKHNYKHDVRKQSHKPNKVNDKRKPSNNRRQSTHNSHRTSDRNGRYKR
nr:hypothetical protein [Clostridia bacterium]